MRIEDPVLNPHHLNAIESALVNYPVIQGHDIRLSGSTGPIDPVLAVLDAILATPIELTEDESNQLIVFVENGLLDPRARPENLQQLVLLSVPSGRPVLMFEFPW